MDRRDILPSIRFLKQANIKGFDVEACWEWSGQKNSSGYGRFIIKGRHRLAHRVSYELFVGQIEDGMNVCHSCDNRLCVNPHHLWTGTQSENLQDAASKSRMFLPNTNGERNGNRKLNYRDVSTIRSMFSGGQKKYWIAKKFGVSPSTISDIISGKTWKEAA